MSVFLINENNLKKLDFFSAYRKKAAEHFNQVGLPTRKLEDWKYLNIIPMTKLAQKTNKQSIYSSEEFLNNLSAETVKKIQTHLNPYFYNLVFVDGLFTSILSEVPRGCKFLNSSDESNHTGVESFIEEFKKYEMDSAKRKSIKILNPFKDLAFVNAENLNVLQITKNQKIDKPLQILNFSSKEYCELSQSSHNLFYLNVEPGAQVEIVFNYQGLENSVSFVNSVNNFVLKGNSKVDVSIVQKIGSSGDRFFNIENNFYLLRDANLNYLTLSLGASTARENLNIFLKEENSRSVVDGLYLVSGNQTMDHHTNIIHEAGHCESLQHYKGILKDNAKSVFNGRIHIQKDSQKANSEQLNNNLILNSNAEVNTKPQLEIDADDVKASHGSTVGQLNAEEIFYLQSRAISKNEAIKLLSQGFAKELIYKKESKLVRDFLINFVSQTFSGWEF